MTRVVWSAALAPALLIVLSAGSPPLRGDDVKLQRSRWAKVYDEIAASFRIRQLDDAKTVFKLRAKPLLVYANPVRGHDQYGAIYLWMHQGRPAAIGSVWSVKDLQDQTRRKVSYELHSLVQQHVAADQGEDALWRTNEAGLDWQRLGEQAAPAASRSLRLVQMRRLVRGVSATIQTGESELRLMSQPLFRYPEQQNGPSDGLIDGAIFAFVMGTDPELFALIEARRDKDGTAWHWAFARLTNTGVTAKHNDQVVFQCRHIRQESPRSTRYFVRFAAERRPARLEASESTVEKR